MVVEEWEDGKWMKFSVDISRHNDGSQPACPPVALTDGCTLGFSLTGGMDGL